MVSLDDLRGEVPVPATGDAPVQSNGTVYVVVDRLSAGSAGQQRVRESLETAFAKGKGKCFVIRRERRRGAG